MGTTGSIVEMKDELNQNSSDQRLKKSRHNNQHQETSLNMSRSKNDVENGIRPTASSFSVDPANSPALNLPLPVTVQKENELKITKEQDIQALLRKEQKLDTENSRLRAELQALNRRCQKLRAERDTATESCHEATQRAISLEQDREKIQRQFKIFRETKESEIQALLQEKRKLESQLHRMQAHGVATGDDHNYTSSAKAMKQHVIIPDSPTPPNQWWGAAESETTSLFGSYSQLRNAVHLDNNSSLSEFRSIEPQRLQNGNPLAAEAGNWQLTNSANFGSNSMLPHYADSECLERNYLRCYIAGTPDCQKEINNLMQSAELKQLKESCYKEGCFLSVITLDGLNSGNPLLSGCIRFVSVDEIIGHGVEISDLVICFLGHKIGRYTELECRLGHLDQPGAKSTLFCLRKENMTKEAESQVCSSLRQAIENSKNRSLKYFVTVPEGVTIAIKEIARTVRLELGVGIDNDEIPSDDVGCVEEMQLDESMEQEQREIALIREDDIKPVGFEKYYERLNDLVSSPGPMPPLIISGGSGSGKTLLIKNWIECLRNMKRNLVVFQHYVASSKSPSADPVIMIRRLLFQLCSKLPPSLAPPSFAISSYDVAYLKTALPRWLERLSTSKNAGVVLAVDSMDLIWDAQKHFKWLLDPLPVGVRIIISVGVNSCPDVWRQWPTLHLEPLSLQSVRGLLSEVADTERVSSHMLENDVTSQCRTASTCHPLYVSILLRVLSSVCQNNKKESLSRICLKTKDTAELYKALLKNLEEECISGQFQQQFRQILLFISCSRSGLNECELLQIIPGLTWQTWLCNRYMLVRFLILTERAGVLSPHNSQISSLLHEMSILEKSTEKSTLRALVQHFARNSSPDYPRTADILPWLLHKAKSESSIRECLLQPYIFHNMFVSARAGEIVHYWQFCEEDKQGIARQYTEMLSSATVHMTRPQSREGSGKRRRSLFPEHASSALTPTMMANVCESVGRFFRDLGLMENGVAAIQRSMEIREAELYPDHPLVANSLHFLASVYAKWKKYGMAESLLKQALELMESAVGREHPRIIQELQLLCFIARKQDRHEQADSITERIHSLQCRLGGTLLSSSRLNRMKRRAIKLEELASGEESVNLARAVNELGVLCYVQKNYNSAELFLRRSLAMREKLLGEDHGDVAQSLHNLSAVYNEQRRYPEAVNCMKKALKIRQDIFGPNNPQVLSTTQHLAVLYKKSKKFDLARDVYEQVLHMSEQINGEDDSATATALVNLAIVESHLGNHQSALPLFEHAKEIYSSRYGPSSKQVADTLKNIAVLRYNRGELEEAANLYKKSIGIKEDLRTKQTSMWR